MEIKEWVGGDQATGRLSIIPNGYVLTKTINNYTKDHNFIWDEITVPITYDSDCKEAYDKMLKVVVDVTKDIIERANKELSGLEEKYYVSKRPAEPAIFLNLTENWISFGIRYVTEVRLRRILRDRISRLILEEISKSEKIKIASQTLTVSLDRPL